EGILGEEGWSFDRCHQLLTHASVSRSIFIEHSLDVPSTCGIPRKACHEGAICKRKTHYVFAVVSIVKINSYRHARCLWSHVALDDYVVIKCHCRTDQSYVHHRRVLHDVTSFGSKSVCQQICSFDFVGHVCPSNLSRNSGFTRSVVQDFHWDGSCVCPVVD